jgi:secreted trypsin-like serine protease
MLIFFSKLKSPITFTDQILPACFPTTVDAVPLETGATTWATGWGAVSEGGSSTNNLMQVDLSVLPSADCEYNNYLENSDSQFCAGSEGLGKDTCQGDSGGPLVAQDSTGKWFVVGITSWGYGCVGGGVYTRVSFMIFIASDSII